MACIKLDEMNIKETSLLWKRNQSWRKGLPSSNNPVKNYNRNKKGVTTEKSIHSFMYGDTNRDLLFSEICHCLTAFVSIAVFSNR